MVSRSPDGHPVFLPAVRSRPGNRGGRDAHDADAVDADVINVRIEGLVFDLSRSSGMLIRDSEHCLIASGTLKRFAGNGITMTGGYDNGIFGCDLYSLGRRVTEVTGGDRKTLTPARHFVENCWMHSFGRLDRTYVPAVQLEGCGNRIAHNLMGDCPSRVVRFEGNDHVLEYNRVYRALLESEDQGAMETFGNPTYRGVVFRHNHFSDIGPRERMEGPAGRAAIRLDDAISGMLIYGNIFHRAAQGFGGIQINGGRDNLIDNNLFAECEKGISGGYNASNNWWQRVNTAPAFTVTDLYLKRYPDLRRLGTEPAWNSAWRNVFWKCGPTFNTYGRPSADKFDLLANAEYADGDPGFVDAPTGDFRLHPDAPLFSQLGFRPIPMNEISLYAHPLRKLAGGCARGDPWRPVRQTRGGGLRLHASFRISDRHNQAVVARSARGPSITVNSRRPAVHDTRPFARQRGLAGGGWCAGSGREGQATRDVETGPPRSALQRRGLRPGAGFGFCLHPQCRPPSRFAGHRDRQRIGAATG